MKRAGGTALTVTAALFVCGPVAGQEDVEIQGKPVSQWVIQLRGDNRGLQLRAARALAEAPEGLRAKIVPHLIPVLRSERENDRFAAAQALGEYGPVARAAASDLLPLLEGTQFERNRAAAAKALGQILKDAEPSEEVEKVTQALLKVFNDTYPDVRREAVTACGMIGPAAKSCIPHLKERLDDNQWPPWEYGPQCFLVQRAAAWTVGRMGSPAAGYIDKLIAMMHANKPDATEFVDAVGALGPVHKNVVPNIVDKLEKTIYGGYQFVSGEALRNYWAHCLAVLEKFGRESAPAVDMLARLLDPEQMKREPARTAQVLKVLGAIGPEAARVAPVIEKNCLSAGDEQVRKAAEQALATIKSK